MSEEEKPKRGRGRPRGVKKHKVQNKEAWEIEQKSLPGLGKQIDVKPGPKDEAKKMGRPSSYRPEYCQMLIDHMSKGFSFQTFAPSINVGHSSVVRWLADPEREDFRQARKIAEGRNRLFWESIGIAAVHGEIEKFNATVWIFNMKNRFGWRDKIEAKVEVEHVEPYIIQRLDGGEVELGVKNKVIEVEAEELN